MVTLAGKNVVVVRASRGVGRFAVECYARSSPVPETGLLPR